MTASSESKHAPKGLVVLSVFYAVNAFFFIITSLIFFDYLNIIICGKAVSAVTAAIVRLFLIIATIYLVIGLYRLKKRAYFAAVLYQAFFILNGLTVIYALVSESSRIKPLMEIALKPEYRHTRPADLAGAPVKAYAVQILGLLISAFIIAYLYKNKSAFKS